MPTRSERLPIASHLKSRPTSSNCTSDNSPTSPTVASSIPCPRRCSFLQRRWTACASWPPASLPVTWNLDDCYLTFGTSHSNRIHQPAPPLQPRKMQRQWQTHEYHRYEKQNENTAISPR